MSISPVNSSNPLDPSLYQPVVHPLHDLKTLQTAIKSGDFAGAQQALATFQNDLLIRSQKNPSMPPMSDDPQIASDLAALQTALSSNDVDSAHQAFVTLRHDLRIMRQQQHQVVEGPMPPTVVGETDPAAQTGNILDTQA